MTDLHIPLILWSTGLFEQDYINDHHSNISKACQSTLNARQRKRRKKRRKQARKSK